MLKTRNEEIEYVHDNRVEYDIYDIPLIRDFAIIRKVVISATDTYTNLSAFLDDYGTLYHNHDISSNFYNCALNDLYLLALLHIDDEEYEQIRKVLENDK